MKQIKLLSFGFKYGEPPAANLLFDMRFLANPFYVEGLRALTGADQPVADYVLTQDAAREFLATLTPLLATAIAGYIRHGHEHDSITIAFGCTGGKHRSVCMTLRAAEIVRDILSQLCIDPQVLIEHRDLGRE